MPEKSGFSWHEKKRVVGGRGGLGDPIRPGKVLNNNNLTCKECPKPVIKEATNGGAWPRVIYMFLIMFTRYFHIIRHEAAVMLHNELFIASGMVTTA
jgi:hypothetical protein